MSPSTSGTDEQIGNQSKQIRELLEWDVESERAKLIGSPVVASPSHSNRSEDTSFRDLLFDHVPSSLAADMVC